MSSLPNKGAQSYFDRVPSQWDSFYSNEGTVRYFLNRIFRKGLYRRYQLTFEHCGDLSGASVLDIGCGTGRYSIECAKRGARKVVGVDFAPQMIEFSKNIAADMGIGTRCEFLHADFLEHRFEGTFDVILALGVFDYISDPSAMLGKIASMRPGKFIASFPQFTPFWGLQRHVRYNLIKKCPIYYYTSEQLNALYRAAPFARWSIIPCGRGFVGVGGDS